MNIDTALNHESRAIQAVKDLINTARGSHLTSAEITERYLLILDSIKHCPRWLRAGVEGYFRAMRDNLWREVEFCYADRDDDGNTILVAVDHDGSSTREHTTRDYYAAGKAAYVCTLKGAHYWKGTDKRYT